jgi:hypothetical protein
MCTGSSRTVFPVALRLKTFAAVKLDRRVGRQRLDAVHRVVEAVPRMTDPSLRLRESASRICWDKTNLMEINAIASSVFLKRGTKRRRTQLALGR